MELEECERLIHEFLDKRENETAIHEMINRQEQRLIISLDKLREYNKDLAAELIKKPSRMQALFEEYLNVLIDEDEVNKKQKIKQRLHTKQNNYKVSFTGNFGKNMISPRGLNANLANQLVCVQGIVTRTSIVRPKLVKSYHYCEETKQGSIKEYNDQFTNDHTYVLESMNKGGGKNMSNNMLFNNNSVPMKDIYGNPLSFEYGLSEFRDFQTILIQEPPERTPLGQLPRSIEVILQDDLVDNVKPGDRIQIVGIFKCIATSGTAFSGNFKTVIIASSLHSLTTEINVPKLSGDDIREIKKIAEREDCMELLGQSLAPSIFGCDLIKKALVLQLLGGMEKNLDNGTHLRGDINILLIGDPSTAKSQFLRHILSLAPNAIATTGRGSTGVGLTAAVIVDKDTGERHLEAGAMVLADRGIVCIDEFDKMNEIDRVAIHEVMEQQTVTIAKAGIHVSLNARCSVLSAANPIYGQYQKDLPSNKNIGLPDSLLSRFDLVFIVLDEDDPEMDRNIADRVIRNHQFPAETASLFTGYDEKIIEPEINLDFDGDHQVFEKHNKLIHGNSRAQILTRNFLKKYLYYAKKVSEPALTDDAKEYITNSWTDLRVASNDKNQNLQAVHITVRTLETLIRLSTAHAKARLSKVVSKKDCEFAENLLKFSLLADDDSDNKKEKKKGKDYKQDEEVDEELSENKPKDNDEENTTEKYGVNTRSSKKKAKEKERLKQESKKGMVTMEKDSGVVVGGKIPSKSKEMGSVLNATSLPEYNLSDEYIKHVNHRFLNLTKSKASNNISLNDFWNEFKNDEKNTIKIINQKHLIELLKKMGDIGTIFFNEGDNTIHLI